MVARVRRMKFIFSVAPVTREGGATLASPYVVTRFSDARSAPRRPAIPCALMTIFHDVVAHLARPIVELFASEVPIVAQKLVVEFQNAPRAHVASRQSELVQPICTSLSPNFESRRRRRNL